MFSALPTFLELVYGPVWQSYVQAVLSISAQTSQELDKYLFRYLYQSWTETKVLLSNLYVVLTIASLAMAIAKNITKGDFRLLYFVLYSAKDFIWQDIKNAIEALLISTEYRVAKLCTM